MIWKLDLKPRLPFERQIFEIAEEYALGSARKMAPNSEFSIMSVRTADERDLPNGCQIYVREKRHFGFPQRKHHLMDH